jgi:hypothetical protein
MKTYELSCLGNLDQLPALLFTFMGLAILLCQQMIAQFLCTQRMMEV